MRKPYADFLCTCALSQWAVCVPFITKEHFKCSLWILNLTLFLAPTNYLNRKCMTNCWNGHLVTLPPILADQCNSHNVHFSQYTLHKLTADPLRIHKEINYPIFTFDSLWVLFHRIEHCLGAWVENSAFAKCGINSFLLDQGHLGLSDHNSQVLPICTIFLQIFTWKRFLLLYFYHQESLD